MAASTLLKSCAMPPASVPIDSIFWACVSLARRLGGTAHASPKKAFLAFSYVLVPLGLGVAHKINLMSGFFSALAVAFMYLAAVRLQRTWQEDPSGPVPAWIGRVGAQDLLEQALATHRLRRQLQRQALVEHAAERPDVRARVHRLAARLLWAHWRGGF